MAETLIFEMATPMKGTPPDVPLAADIQLGELTEGDERPMFVTLQIGEAGARSRNDREYPREVEEKVVAAINEQRVGGIRGHLRDDQRGTAHPEMVWRWVGAMMDEQGRVWGKAYVLPTQAQAREEIRTAMAANARIGTSRYATGTIDEEGMVEADTYQLEGIDYVHEARVGIPVTSVVPRITRESTDPEERAGEREADPEPETHPPRGGDVDDNDNQSKRETSPMGDDKTFSLAEIQERITEARKDDRAEITRLNSELSEAQNKLADYEPVIESLGNPKYPDVALRAKLAELDNLRRENEQLLQGYIESQVAENVKSEAVRPMVTTLIKSEEPSTRAEVDNAVAAVLGRAEVKALLKAQTAAEMGPKLKDEPTTPGDEMPETTPSADATTVAEMMWS
jgi:hypothetical protein